MAGRLLVVALLIPLAYGARAALPGQTPGNASPQTPSNASPVSPLPGVSDPAAATFSTDVGLLLVAVKPDKAADYEEVIRALQDALSKASDEETRQVAAGWRVYKASDLDAKANAIYVHVLLPAVQGTDYRPSLWLDKLLAGAPADLLAKYRDSFATPPTKLPLVEFANMTVAPVPKPGNGSPAAPVVAKPPGK